MSLEDKRRIVLHHSATADGETFSWAAIRRYHVDTNGWSDIGYHFGVERVGSGYEIMVGRMLGARAAAVKEANMNTLGVHICLVGNFDDAPPPDAQYKLTLRLIRELLDILHLTPDAVHFHREYALKDDGKPYKSCPGWAFPPIERVRFDIASGH